MAYIKRSLWKWYVCDNCGAQDGHHFLEDYNDFGPVKKRTCWRCNWKWYGCDGADTGEEIPIVKEEQE
jgi:hypothetical protein